MHSQWLPLVVPSITQHPGPKPGLFCAGQCAWAAPSLQQLTGLPGCRFFFRSGNIEHPEDKLFNTSVEVLPFDVSVGVHCVWGCTAAASPTALASAP